MPDHLPPSLRWLLFAGAALGGAAVLLLLPPGQSTPGFTLLIGGVLLVTAYQRRTWTAFLAAGGVIGGTLVLLALPSTWSAPGFALLIGGSLWAVIRLRRAVRAAPVQPAQSVSRPALCFRKGPALLAAGVLALALLAKVNAGGPGLSPHLQMALFVGGTGLVVWGIGGKSLRSLIRRPDRDWQIVALITLLALIVRVWHLGSTVHTLIDEMHYISGLLDLRDRHDARLLAPLNDLAALPHVYSYFQLLAVDLLGPDLFGLRLPSAILGALTVPALYLLAQTWWDRPTALVAALLMAGFAPHLHFSRLGMINIGDPLFGVLALAFLARGLKTNRPADYALSGAALGWAQYFYEGGRLLFTLLVMLWVGWIVLTQRSRAPWRGLLQMLLTAGLVAMPLYVTLFVSGSSLTPRAESEAIRPSVLSDLFHRYPVDQALRLYFTDHVQPALTHLVWTTDSSHFYYGGRGGLIAWYLVPAFLIGLCVALRRCPLLLVWVVLVVIGNSLLVIPDWSQRYIAVLPALALLTAAGLRTAWKVITRGDHTATLITLTAVLVVLQVYGYFGPHLALYNRQVRRYIRDYYDALDRTRDYPPDSQVYFIGDDLMFWPTVEFMQRLWRLDQPILHLEPRPLPEGTFSEMIPADKTRLLDESAIATMPRDRTLLFFVEPDDPAVVELLQQYFDLQGPYWSRYSSVPRDRQYALYVVMPPGPY